jgi:hypothetical protein
MASTDEVGRPRHLVAILGMSRRLSLLGTEAAFMATHESDLTVRRGDRQGGHPAAAMP